MTFPLLYPIVDVDLCRMRGLEPRALAAAFVAGGARIMQVRQKAGGSGALLALVAAIAGDAAPAGASVIVNDRADLAALAGAAGVHVGQQDLPADVAKSILATAPAFATAMAGTGLVGVSTHTPAQVDEALRGAADYVAVGPVFRTSTKDTGYQPRGLELVRYASGKGKPVVAIGGISLENAREVIAAGAASVAIISDLLLTADPEARVRQYLQALA